MLPTGAGGCVQPDDTGQRLRYHAVWGGVLLDTYYDEPAAHDRVQQEAARQPGRRLLQLRNQVPPYWEVK